MHSTAVPCIRQKYRVFLSFCQIMISLYGKCPINNQIKQYNAKKYKLILCNIGSLTNFSYFTIFCFGKEFRVSGFRVLRLLFHQFISYLLNRTLISFQSRQLSYYRLTYQRRNRMSSKNTNCKNKRSSQVQLSKKSLISQDKKSKRESIQKIKSKNIKRIGCKNIIKAFKATVQEKQLATTLAHNLNSPEGGTLNQKQLSKEEKHKKLKRIGRKKIIAAYSHLQTSQFQNSQLIPEEQQILNEIIEPEIQVENTKISEPEIDILDQDKNQQDYSHTDINDSFVMKKVNSEQGKGDQSSDSFSINVNRVTNNSEARHEVVSVLDKSDKCIQSFIKSDSEQGGSDQAASHSVIVHGQFQKLINQSEIYSSTENDKDSKIQQLLEEIEQNYKKNAESNTKLQIVNQNIEKPVFGNHLSVPYNKKYEHRFSNGLKEKNNKSSQSKRKIPEQKQNRNIDNKIHKNNNEQNQKTEQEKLMELIDKKNNEKNRSKIYNGKRNSKTKKSTLRQINSGQKKSSKIYSNNGYKQNIQNQNAAKRKQKQTAEKIEPRETQKQQKLANNQQIKNNEQKNILLQKFQYKIFPQRQRLLVTEGPKRTHVNVKNDDKKMTKSHMNIIQTAPNSHIGQSQVTINIVKVKQQKPSNYYTSLHQNANLAELKQVKQSVQNKSGLKKFKKSEKIDKNDESAFLSSAKRNHKQLQINRYVNQAKKMLGQITNN